jgi:hypothetical protein
MIDQKIKLTVERIDNGLLVTGEVNGEPMKCYFGNVGDIMELLTHQLKTQHKEANQFEWTGRFSLSLEADDLD